MLLNGGWQFIGGKGERDCLTMWTYNALSCGIHLLRKKKMRNSEVKKLKPVKIQRQKWQ